MCRLQVKEGTGVAALFFTILPWSRQAHKTGFGVCRLHVKEGTVLAAAFTLKFCPITLGLQGMGISI